MNQSKERLEKLNSMLNHANYLGSDGAIEYFKQNFLPEAMANLEAGNIVLLVKYVEILDRAAMSEKDSGFFQKIKKLFTFYSINSLMKKIKESSGRPYSGYGSEQLIVLLRASIDVVSHTKQCGFFASFLLSSMVLECKKEITRFFDALIKKGEDDKRSSDSPIFLNYRPARRIALEAEGVMYEYTRERSDDFIKSATMYCERNSQSRDRDVLRTVCSLYCSLDLLESAIIVAKRLGSRDMMQQIKARVR